MAIKIESIKQYVKKQPLVIGAAVLIVASSIGIVAYRQSQQTALQRKQVESEAQLANKIDESKKTNEARIKKIEEDKKAKEEAEAAAKKLAEEKATAEAEAIAVAQAEKEKAYSYTDTEKEKEYEQKSYESVSVSLSRSGSVLSATIGSTKTGTCNFTFKEYVGGEKKNYSSLQVAAANGVCNTKIPEGIAWTNAYVTYKASDYSAKGYADIGL